MLTEEKSDCLGLLISCLIGIMRARTKNIHNLNIIYLKKNKVHGFFLSNAFCFVLLVIQRP